MMKMQIPEKILKRLDDCAMGERARRVQQLSFSAAAFLVCEMRRACSCPVLLVTSNMKDQDEMLHNLAAFAGGDGRDIVSFPAYSDTAGREISADLDTTGERINAALRLARGGNPLIATCIQAMGQAAISPSLLLAQTISLSPGADADPAAIVPFLEKAGYEFGPEVQNKGEAALRGGLLDIWPPTEREPFRVEFFGSTVETIRSFNPADQRSTGKQELALITPAGEPVPDMDADRTFFTSHIKGDVVFLWFRCEDGEELDAAVKAAAQPGARHFISGWDFAAEPEGESEMPIDLGFRTIPEIYTTKQNLFEPDLIAEQRKRLIEYLQDQANAGVKIHLSFDTGGSLERFQETHPGLPCSTETGIVTDGFINPDAAIAVLGESLIMGRRKLAHGKYESGARRRRARTHAAGETITDWTGITPGDLVVHVDHGIGRYLGMMEIEFNGQLMESLAVEYAEGAKLYVPVSQSHLLSRYVGSGRQQAGLHRLGGSTWKRAKQSAERAVQDLAASLLQIQAMRESMEGFPYPPDTEWQHEFEGAFPYQETDDQSLAIEQVKGDMQALRPMDRLICGDVGYGKTEVAMRAAFKAATAGKQVAVLVPTTVLAQQHYEVFTERMGAYPFNIELLCRFRTHQQQRRAIAGLVTGAVDIAIGTHRLLQSDVKFKNLGLVIIDEEQRFGVAHKEQLKQMRQLVDVLTLTATPIPRTLYMSLTGARDISMIQTAPEERLPVETIVAPREDKIVRDAIRRELGRGGQVYYLHNRINSIEPVRQWLLRLAPEARIAVGHGQTPTAELSNLMRDFEQGAYDILLCTTIIQSGVDIPNVNTILIDRADRFGVADLYQLRGRVGRSSRKGYAYLLLPPKERLVDESRKRIQAILQHTGLGSGFRLALRDLEIRGVGNLLGHEQSGHIAAVGFDLYCQLLKRTVSQMAAATAGGGTPPPIVNVEIRLDFISLSTNTGGGEPAAYLPHDYVEDERQRLGIYRKIAGTGTPAEVASLRTEFKDRFGAIPVPLDRLLLIAEIRIIAAAKNINSIETNEGKIMMKRGGEYILPDHLFPRLRSERAGERLAELKNLIETLDFSDSP